jgi:hypothetical protein
MHESVELDLNQDLLLMQPYSCATCLKTRELLRFEHGERKEVEWLAERCSHADLDVSIILHDKQRRWKEQSNNV